MYINKFIQILTSYLYFVNTIQQNHRAVSQFKERNYHGISIRTETNRRTSTLQNLQRFHTVINH